MEKKELFSKYLKVVDEIGSIQKDATNPFAKSKYSTLSNIQKHVRPVLNKHSLLFTMNFTLDSQINNMYNCIATLIDIETEQKHKFYYTIPYDETQKNPVQGFGSTMTYGQRYVYGIVFNIPFDDEDPDSGKTKGANCEKKETDSREWLNEGTSKYKDAVKYLKNGGDISAIEKKYRISKKTREQLLNDSI
jgi:hypothetical protein